MMLGSSRVSHTRKQTVVRRSSRVNVSFVCTLEWLTIINGDHCLAVTEAFSRLSRLPASLHLSHAASSILDLEMAAGAVNMTALVPTSDFLHRH